MSPRKIRADKAVSARLKQEDAQTIVAQQLDRSMFDYANLVNIIPLDTEYSLYISASRRSGSQ